MLAIVRNLGSRLRMPKRYWLLKSDPGTFGWADLESAPKKSTVWDGIRNYQARNHLRDDVQKGDGALFYHSGEEKAVVGTCKVTRAGFPEPGKPPWVAIEIELEGKLAAPVTLQAMREEPALAGMVLLKNSRLSVQPVTEKEWSIVTRLGGSTKRSAR